VLRCEPPSRGVAPLHTDASGTAPPDAFGPFQVLHQVGAGALGPVFRGYDTRRERLVAIKLFRLNLPPEQMHKLVEQFERLIAAELAHPALAVPIATGTDGIVVYLVRDFVAADSLDVVVRDSGPAPPSHALHVVATLAEALDFAAGVDIHHGALHPRDVLLSQDETRLTGLGVSAALEKIGVAVSVRRPYAAPERLAGASWGRAADVFGLAALTHELLSGRRPAALGEEAARMLPDVSGSVQRTLRAVFAQALAEKPSHRFETAEDFAVALRSAFPGVRLASTETTRDESRTSKPESTAEAAESSRSPQMPSDARLPLDESETEPTPVVATSASDTTENDATLRLKEVVSTRYADVEDLTAVMSRPSAPDAAGSSEATIADTALSRARGEQQRQRVGGRKLPDSLTKWGAAAGLVAAVLILGVGLGFWGGYSVGSRRDPASLAAAATGPGAGQRIDHEEPSQAKPATGAVEASPTNQPPAPTADAKADVTAARTERNSVAPPARKTEATATKKGGSTRTGPSDGATLELRNGRILVRSSPAGARVDVDGEPQGMTPTAIRNLTHGPHRIRLTLAGYGVEERRITISSAQPAQSLVIDLEPTRIASVGTDRPRPPAARSVLVSGFSGALHVESRPDGAEVFVDGVAKGLTPLVIGQIEAGEHVVRLERSGFRRWSASVRVVTGARNRVTASLEK